MRSDSTLDRRSFLPTSRGEMDRLGWDRPDVVLVSGDAYVDHPSFAAAIIGRWLEHHGFRVAILAQADWRSAEPWRALGRPRLFYGVSAGNMDSMVNHYTANLKRRNTDAYSPGGRIELRPDRATAAYAQRCREAFKGVPVIAGGVEASLRRLAHYDYWSDRVMPSILATSKADLVVFGMGEGPILEIARRLDAGQAVQALRDLRGVAYMLGSRESLLEHGWEDSAGDGQTLELPAYERVKDDTRSFAVMTRIIHRESNPMNGRRLTQAHGDRTVVVNPAALPLATAELDRVYGLPFTRRPHPAYSEPIPAWEMIRDSVQIMRGCFGGCTFCSLTLHQGRVVQSRSQESVLAEIQTIAGQPDFKGHVSDLGGPTANMYRMGCSKPEAAAVCRRHSCLYPTICTLLDADHRPLVELMRASRQVPGVGKISIASGIRMDLAQSDPAYLAELVRHHVGGHLKVAPEHVNDQVLACMHKPSRQSFDAFARRFEQASQEAGKEQYLVPYFIASHPGSGVAEMIELALYLKRHGYRPRQVQDFIPAPMDVATCMYHTGCDPLTMKPVATARGQHARQAQRALLQYFKPESWREVREILVEAGRTDLIGSGPDCLIPSRPPARAWRGRTGRGRRRGGGQRQGAGPGREPGGSRRPRRETG